MFISKEKKKEMIKNLERAKTESLYKMSLVRSKLMEKMYSIRKHNERKR